MTVPPRALNRIEEAARTLRADGTPYAMATIVRTQDATAAKAGAKALLDATGDVLEGFVGGGCVRAALARAARAAVARGEPVFVALRPDDRLADAGARPCEVRDGVVFERNGCASQGSMDVFVEPFVPVPELAVLGDGPVAQALAQLARSFDLCVVSALPEPQGAQRALYIVVATQGKGDAAMLEAALNAGSDYIAFVGSRRKAATLKEKLVPKVPTSALARLIAPAGLDIGAETAEEIALSILAQIVQHRRRNDAVETPAADGVALLAVR
ncbi:MAG: XdhC family protein [Pseudomonadota bacterium]